MEEKKGRRRKKIRPILGEKPQPSRSPKNRTVDENGLLAIAVKQGLLRKQQAEEIKEQITATRSVEKILLDEHYVDENQLMKLQSVQTGIRIIDLFTVERETAVLDLVPKKFAQKNQLFPVKKRKGRLVVAMVNPMAYDVINELRLITGMSALPYFASSSG